jgi:hypothetical protein
VRRGLDDDWSGCSWTGASEERGAMRGYIKCKY